MFLQILIYPPPLQLTKIKPLRVHVDSRKSPYPDSEVKRFTVADNKVSHLSSQIFFCFSIWTWRFEILTLITVTCVAICFW